MISLILILVVIFATGIAIVVKNNDEKLTHLQRRGSLWRHVWSRVRMVPEQYPLAVVAALSLCIVGFIIVGAASFWDEEQYTRIIMTLVTLFLVSVSAEMWSRAHGYIRKSRLLMQLGVVIFVSAYALLLPQDFAQQPFDFVLAHIMWYSCFFALLFIAAHIGCRETRNQDFYGQSALIITAIAIGFLFAVTAFLLGALLLWSLDALFHVDVDNAFAYWWVVVVTLVGPIMALSRLPERATHVLADQLPKVLQILVQYVIMPFVLLYFLVLYAYTGKIVVLWEWPEGIVSWMIIIFSIIGWGAYVVIFPWCNTHRLFGLFVKWFPWIALPQIVMLFIALWWRVDAYGITVNRYFVALFGLWLLVNALYFALVRHQKLITLFWTFILCTFFASFGPWGVFAVSENSQVQRLQEVLVKYNLLQSDGSARTTEDGELDRQVQNNLISIIDYIAQTHGEDALGRVMPQVLVDVQSTGDCDYGCTWKIHEAFGLSAATGSADSFGMDEYIAYHYGPQEYNGIVSVSVDGYMHALIHQYFILAHGDPYTFVMDGTTYDVHFGASDIMITAKETDVQIRIDLHVLLEEVRNVSQREVFAREYSDANTEVQFIITHIEGSGQAGNREIHTLGGALLFRHIQ